MDVKIFLAERVFNQYFDWIIFIVSKKAKKKRQICLPPFMQSLPNHLASFNFIPHPIAFVNDGSGVLPARTASVAFAR